MLLTFLIIITVKNVYTDSSYCDISVDITEGKQFNSTHLFHNNIYYAKEHIFEKNGKKHGCICKYKGCIQKCCKENQHFLNDSRKCIDNVEEITHQTHDGKIIDLTPFHIIHGDPNGDWCSSTGVKYSLMPSKGEEDIFKIHREGHAELINMDEDPIINAFKFCFEHYHDLNYTSILICDETASDDAEMDEMEMEIMVSGTKENTQFQPCEISIDISEGKSHETNGVFHNDIYYAEEHVFLKNGKKHGCICYYKPCLRKCCLETQHHNGKKCVDNNNTIPAISHDGKEMDHSSFHIIHGELNGNWCNGSKYRLYPHKIDGDMFLIHEKGHIVFPGDDTKVEALKFCMEHFHDINYTSLVVCTEVIQEVGMPEVYMHVSGMIISLPFLLITFLVYALTPELRNLHGKCLLCYVLSLFIAYIFLITIQIGKNTISKDFCKNGPFIIYFGFMASFLWLNAMSFDIWWTFSGRRGFVGSIKQSEHKRYLMYSAYCWGVALIMTAVTITMQFANVSDTYIRPEFGEGRCWFNAFKSTMAYFYGPIMSLIMLNIFFFAWTTIKIYQVKKETEKSMRHDSQRHGDETDKQRFKIYLKLILVFGVNWSMEIISFMIEGPRWLWYVTDLCNALYGVFIFIIFVCKRNVWKLLKKRYHSLMGRPYLAHSYTPTSDHTRSTGAGADSYAMTADNCTSGETN